MDWQNNTILSTTGDSPLAFTKPRLMTFEDNYLEDCTGIEYIDNSGEFKKNVIINSYLQLQNIQPSPMTSGSIGDFNENTIKDSEVNI
jgi:hypothetical protein